MIHMNYEESINKTIKELERNMYRYSIFRKCQKQRNFLTLLGCYIIEGRFVSQFQFEYSKTRYCRKRSEKCKQEKNVMQKR